MLELEGFILAGGASSRMGRDKALLRLGQETFVERVARALLGVTPRIGVVSSRHGGELFGLRVVPDIHQDCGALGGLHSALVNARAPRVLVVSCDLPHVTAGLFERLISLAGDGVEAVAPIQEDGRLQPLCALYERRSCLPVAERLLRDGERRPRALVAQVRATLVNFDQLADLPGSNLFFKNLNSPEDLEEARAALDAARPSE